MIDLYTKMREKLELINWDSIEEFMTYVATTLKNRYYIKSVEKDSEGKITCVIFTIFTEQYEYHILVSLHYLGCTSSCRKHYIGEKHTRGSDLPDGKFNMYTWVRILNNIIEDESEFIKMKQKDLVFDFDCDNPLESMTNILNNLSNDYVSINGSRNPIRYVFESDLVARKVDIKPETSSCTL